MPWTTGRRFWVNPCRDPRLDVRPARELNDVNKKPVTPVTGLPHVAVY